MRNKFKIIICSYNNEKWVEDNLTSVMEQDYPNYEIYYFNGGSTDNTLNLVAEKLSPFNNKSQIISTYKRTYKTEFFCNLPQIDETDILVFVDGDDMLCASNALTYLDQIYEKTDCWLTYGGMKVWDGMSLTDPSPQNSEIPENVKQTRSYRKDTWRTSHLKTMRGFVWNSIDKSDFKPNGKYMVGPDDLAIMFAALELCPSEKVYRINEFLYIYNHSEQNQHSRAFTDHKETNIDYESIVRNRTPYNPINVVSSTLAGGLGNQLFQIATALSLANDSNSIAFINPDYHILPNQGNNVNTYLDNILSRINTDKNLKLENKYVYESNKYLPIPLTKNVQLNGHFQSYLYFHHNQKLIYNTFYPTPTILTEINKIDNRLETCDTDSILGIQVRRGDYYKFPNHHPMLPVQYFYDAVERATKTSNISEIWIFSDSVDWCKENLKFDFPVKYVNEKDYIEIYVMAALKNLIISNSSFGWWGAYLALDSSIEKNIYYPSKWFGPAIGDFDIHELALPEWNKITVI